MLSVLGGTAHAVPVAAGYTVQLTTNDEPRPVDPDGSGFATVSLNAKTGRICVFISVSGIAPVVSGQIHRGRAGTNGPVVVGLPVPSESGRAKGCVALASNLIYEIIADPSGFYINLHNSEFPRGVLRGQIA